ncbi:hypothetical protein [Nocardia brasiliensis]|uniref:hypothetical protein n=1 Tax=Nocardia brasiliensis TaxID=37326 RepID=UPI00367249C2
MRAEGSAAEMVGAGLKLTLDLDVASYDELRAEFLAMTAEAQRASGRSRAALAKLCAGRPGRQTVYNYAGDPAYTSFPKPALLEKYLACCDFTPEQVRFAVARCAEIRRRYPEAGKSSPRKKESPRVSVEHLGGGSGPARPGGSPAAGGQNENARLPVRDDGPLLSQPAGWSTPWRGLARFLSSKKVTAFSYRYLADPRVIRSLSAATYEPLASEVWRPSHLVPPVVENTGPTAPSDAPLSPVEDASEPASTETVMVQYERLMREVTAQVEACGHAADPGLAALRAIEGLVFPFPHEGSQTWLVRAAFKAIDLPLPPEIRFELPVMAVAVRHVHLRPGDIVFTESGVLGIYGGNNELVYLGPGGARTTSVLQPALYVAAWRVTAVPARDGHGLVSKVEMVEHDGAGRLARIYRPGERRSGRHRRCPETAEVVAMVIEVIEEAKRHGVEMPLAGRELFTAALTRGIEFSSVTTAWNPEHEPVYPRDARLRAVQVVPTGGPSTAAELLKRRLSTVPSARWSARNRPGVA